MERTTDQKPIQPKNNEKQRKKERSEAAMAIGGGDGDRRKLVEERLMRGRKIDQMRGAVCRERKREAAES